MCDLSTTTKNKHARINHNSNGSYTITETADRDVGTLRVSIIAGCKQSPDLNGLAISRGPWRTGVNYGFSLREARTIFRALKKHFEG